MYYLATITKALLQDVQLIRLSRRPVNGMVLNLGAFNKAKINKLGVSPSTDQVSSKY